MARRTAWLAAACCMAVLAAGCGGGEQAGGQGEVTLPGADAAPGGGSEAAAGGVDVSEPSAEFEQPGVEGPFADAVAEACTPESSPKIAEIQERGTLQWAVGISPPFAFKDASGAYAGVEADNAAELANILGVEVEIADYSYDLLPPALVNGQADIVGAQLFITPARQQVIDFTDPYFLSGQLFYVLEDSEFETIEDLNVAENRFVYGTGNAQLDIAEKLIPEAEIFDAPLQGQLLLYDFLAADRADSSMVEAQVMPLLVSQYTDPQLVAIGNNGRITEERASDDDIIEPFDVAFGVAKGDRGFLDCLTAWVVDATSTERLTERIEYWSSTLEA